VTTGADTRWLALYLLCLATLMIVLDVVLSRGTAAIGVDAHETAAEAT